MLRAWLGLILLMQFSVRSGVTASTISPVHQTQFAPRGAANATNSADLLYISNTGNNSITVYHHDQQGNSSPIAVIAGSRTGLSNPGNLSEDAQGNLYVANGRADNNGYGRSSYPAVLVFAHGSNGNVAPIRQIAGPLTEFHNISGMTVDQRTGKLFVIDSASICGSGRFLCDNYLLRFAPNANGNVAPFARGNDAYGMSASYQLTSDSTGNNIIDAHYVNAPEERQLGIDTYQKQFANGSSFRSVYDIQAFNVTGVADDPFTSTYLASANGYIYRLRENTFNTYDNLNLQPAPVSTIMHVPCGGNIALGYLRNIYLACGNAVYVYPHDSFGDVRPLRVLTGPATRLNGSYGIYEGK